MTLKRARKSMVIGMLLLILAVLPALAQSGKAELKAPGGAVTIDYGRPSLRGRDMLSQLREGDFWRMGMNNATVLRTPVDLMFGSTKVAKGSYSLWLKKAAGDKYELVFNSQTGQWGTQHNPQQDAYNIPLKKDALASSVEIFTIGLSEAPKGGTFKMSWGAAELSAGFQFGQ